jgi:hypothetical protein
MQFAKRMFMGFGVVAFMTVLLSLSAPKVVHGIVATLVQVANTSANPVPTLEQEAQSAFVAQGTCQISPGGCTVDTLYTVPMGKTAVLESVGFVCATTPAGGMSSSSVQAASASMSFSPPGGGPIVYLPLAPGNPFFVPSGVLQSTGQNLKSYAAGGSSGSNIVFEAFITYAGPTSPTGSCVILLSGHLE